MSKILGLCLGLIALPSLGYGAFEHVLLGARPLGMAGAFTTLADDANALQWNPAGLRLVREPLLHLSYLDLYGLIGYSEVTFVAPHERFGWGVGVITSRDPEGVYREAEVRAGLGMPISRYGTLGLTLRSLSSRAQADDVVIGRSRGVAFDAGITLHVIRHRLWIAATIPSAFAYVRYHRYSLWRGPEESYTESPSRGWRVGLAGNVPGRVPTWIALEVHEGFAWKLGFESTLPQGLTLRAGIQLGAGLNSGWTFGFGYASGPFRIDFGYASGRLDTSTSQMSLGLRY